MDANAPTGAVHNSALQNAVFNIRHISTLQETLKHIANLSSFGNWQPARGCGSTKPCLRPWENTAISLMKSGASRCFTTKGKIRKDLLEKHVRGIKVKINATGTNGI